jgi:hypothetical protein
VFTRAAGIPDTDYRVSDSPRAIAEVLPTPSTQVPAVRVDAEPILV